MKNSLLFFFFFSFSSLFGQSAIDLMVADTSSSISDDIKKNCKTRYGRPSGVCMTVSFEAPYEEKNH